MSYYNSYEQDELIAQDNSEFALLNSPLSLNGRYIPTPQYEQQNFTPRSNGSTDDDEELLFSLELQQPYESNTDTAYTSGNTFLINTDSTSEYAEIDPALQNYKVWLSSF